GRAHVHHRTITEEKLVVNKYLASPVRLIQISASIYPPLDPNTGVRVPVIDRGDVHSWQRQTMTSEQLSDWRKNRHGQTIKTTTHDEMLTQRIAQLLIDDTDVLDNQINIPSEFPRV